ncbi:MAG TPA: carbohydrate ABC transporter permease [Chloroflexota bacterium]|nr:carbohydrate ABC transporter permease [Chloroflexota bacterium]
MARRRTGRFLLYLIAIILGIIVLIPFLWAVSQSFTPANEIFSIPIHVIPVHPTLENYNVLFFKLGDVEIVRWFINSLFVSTAVTVLILLFDSMAAYALSRLRFPGRMVVFFAFISTMLIPAQVTFIPLYVEMQKLGFLDSYNALIWPYLANAFYVFLLRQFFQGIPRDLDEAAIVDGAGAFAIFWRVILPNTKSALAAVGILSFTAVWNDLFWPIVTINSVDLRTLPMGLTIMNLEYGGTPGPGLVMASAVMAFLPVLIVYTIFQRSIVEGISLTGLGGR